jgi:hypothetical protein
MKGFISAMLVGVFCICIVLASVNAPMMVCGGVHAGPKPKGSVQQGQEGQAADRLIFGGLIS